jgi:transcriptional regulator with XRE-family HTH domain
MIGLENKSLVGVSEKLESPKAIDLDSRANLLKRLTRSLSSRIRFVDSHISKGIAFQIQALRDKEGWTQQQLADKLGTNQNAVYRLENPNYGKQTITTLKKVAAIFDVALIVRFVPYGRLVDWVTGNPFVDNGLSANSLAVPNFSEELKLPLGQVPETINVAAQVQTIHFGTLSGRGQLAHSAVEEIAGEQSTA